MSPTSYTLTSFSFSLLIWGILHRFPLKWRAILLNSWTSTGCFSNATGSSVTSDRFSTFIVRRHEASPILDMVWLASNFCCFFFPQVMFVNSSGCESEWTSHSWVQIQSSLLNGRCIAIWESRMACHSSFWRCNTWAMMRQDKSKRWMLISNTRVHKLPWVTKCP